MIIIIIIIITIIIIIIHAPSGCINTVQINLTRMLSGNLYICAINKYTDILCDDNNIQ